MVRSAMRVWAGARRYGCEEGVWIDSRKARVRDLNRKAYMVLPA